MSTLEIASNPIFLEPMKQIEIDCLFVHHHNFMGTLSLPYIASSEQIVDLFTKAHTISHF